MRINIKAIEKYLPKSRISSESLDHILNGRIGRIQKNTGVEFRHHVSGKETVCEMGAIALTEVLNKAMMNPSDIDLLIYAGASFDYPVPHNSVIIKSKICDDNIDFPCIDIDTTCLSFLNALDVAHLYLETKRYQRIAIVCSEIASKALTANDEKVFGLFGDASLAMILESSEKVGYVPIYTDFKNYPSGALYAMLPIGGAVNRGLNSNENDLGYYFKMEGKKLIRLTTKYLDGFVGLMENKLKMKINEFDKIITHQTSKYGNEYMLRKFGLSNTTIIETLSIYGNCVSASIPLGLEQLVSDKTDLKNKKILLLGTGAGLSLGCIVLDFS